ncbi:MAG TPA: hypothetical protein VMH87_05460 [Pseudomonadales bacterium]|nr:hypothetical protein [Pseudomonadales bacterium]
MKRRWKILVVLAAALAVACLIGVVRHYQLRWATEAYIAQLKAQGEPMDLAQVLPPPVPPEQNSADTMRRAAALMKSNQEWWGTNSVGPMGMVAPGKAKVAWWQPDVRSSLSTNSWLEVGSVLAEDKESLSLLHQIFNKPNLDFQINYKAGFVDFSITNLTLMESKRASQLLSGATIYDLHSGDAASAVENIRTALAIIQALRQERYVITELVRMAMANIMVSANWELLQATNLSEQQLSDLQTGWANLDFIQSGVNALEMERASGQVTTAKWRRSNEDLISSVYLTPKARANLGMEPLTAWDKVKIKPRIILWRYWWSYPDELRQIKGSQVLIDTMRAAQTNGSFEEAIENQSKSLDELGITGLDDEFPSLFGGDPNFHSMLSEGITSLSGVARRMMAAETAKRTMITAIALKRYQLKHGNYPPDLKVLVPEFLTAVPLDPVDGQPLRYRLNSDGTFLLYSIGPNGKDDGGNPQLEQDIEGSNFYWLGPHALDWVWPQPATAEEIEEFYAHPPK